MASKRVEESKSGKIIPCMKGTGTTTKRMAGEDSSTLMAMCTRVSGSTTKLTEKECTFIKMELLIPGSGLRTYSMVSASRNGQTDPATKVTTMKDKNTAMENLLGQMDRYILENLSTISSTGKADTSGLMAGPTKETGRPIR